MTFADLDRQLSAARAASETPRLSELAWSHLATTVHQEIRRLPMATLNGIQLRLPIPAARYVEEMTAFQAWMDIAHRNYDNPAIVRAQVMTELYVAFIWLRDSVFKPVGDVMPSNSTFVAIERFLASGQRRLLRNAIAHGRWCYLADFRGLEYWAEPTRGQTHQRFQLDAGDLDAWQLLSRGTAIAALLALTHSGGS